MNRLWSFILAVVVVLGVFPPNRAWARAPAEAETRVGGIDLVVPVVVGFGASASAGLHRGIGGFTCEDAVGATLAAEGGLGAAASEAEGLVANGRTYLNSTRVIERAAAEPGPYHNFPGSFDQVILEQGEQKLSVGFFSRPKAGYGASGVQYTLPGTVNGQQGIFEIGTRLSTSGKFELIMHRFFRPTR